MLFKEITAVKEVLVRALGFNTMGDKDETGHQIRIAHGMIEELEKPKEAPKKCPKCGAPDGDILYRETKVD